jgi:hypothetical protein
MQEGVAEATGDKPFDKMMTTIKQGTNKQKTVDRKEQQKQTQQRARDTFGNMFGGGNPADKLSIRKGMAEGKDPTTDAAQEAYGFQRGEVKKNKDGSYTATNHAGSRKIFKSEKSAKAHADSDSQGVAEGPTDHQKRRQRERDVDAGRPVKPLPKNPQTDYARKRAKDRKDMEMGEGLLKEPATRKEYLDQRDRLFRMMAVDSNPANKQIIKQALQDLETRYGNLKNTVKEAEEIPAKMVMQSFVV